MKLQEKITSDIKQAMRDKKTLELSTLRMIKSEIEYELNKTGASEIEDDGVLTILKRAVKKRQEAKEQYEKGGRTDLADSERLEMEFISTYLPAAVSEDEIRAKVDHMIAQTSDKNFGVLMGKVMASFKGSGKSIDGTLVNKILKETLG